MKKTLSRKLGPLPAWSWILIATGTLLAVWYWRKQQAANASATTTPSTLSGDLLPSTAPYYQTPTSGSGGSGGGGVTSPDTPYLQNIEGTLAGIQNQIAGLNTSPGQVDVAYAPTSPPPTTVGSSPASTAAWDKWWKAKEANKDAAAAANTNAWNAWWTAKQAKKAAVTRRTTTHKYSSSKSSSGTRSSGTSTVRVGGQRQSNRTVKRNTRGRTSGRVSGRG